MTQTLISSRAIIFFKWFVPVLLGLILLLSFASAIASGAPAAIMGPVFFSVLIFFILKKFLFNQMDEVYDCGDAVLAKRGKQEERIAFANIEKLTYSVQQKPPAITLWLKNPGVFGNKITFTAPMDNRMRRNPLIAQLNDKIGKAA